MGEVLSCRRKRPRSRLRSDFCIMRATCLRVRPSQRLQWNQKSTALHDRHPTPVSSMETNLPTLLRVASAEKPSQVSMLPISFQKTRCLIQAQTRRGLKLETGHPIMSLGLILEVGQATRNPSFDLPFHSELKTSKKLTSQSLLLVSSWFVFKKK